MTKNRTFKKFLSCVLISVLVAAMALMGTACTRTTNQVVEQSVVPEVESVASEEVSEVASEVADARFTEASVIGEGTKELYLEVVYADGKADYFLVKNDAENVGDALVAAGIVEGEDSEYGLYIKTVNGVTADYNVDQSYWAFYINGEYAQAGVSDTAIEEGAIYTLKVEK
jgi:hypothetical protein